MTAVLWFTGLLVGANWLGMRWALITGLVMAYGLWALWRGLPQNYRAGETAVLPTLGWGNGLTLARGAAICMVAGFLFSPWPDGRLAWLPMALYTAADIADYFDGYLARITNHATQLGARLDMEFDGLGMLVVSLLAVWYGQLPPWYLALGLARYLFVAGLWWRAQRGLPNRALPPSVHRRIFAGFLMGFMSVVLWPIVPPAAATIAGTIFAGATAVSFLRDWLVTIGWLETETAVYRRWQARIVRLTTKTLPPILRLALAVSLISLLTSRPDWSLLFARWGWSSPPFWGWFWLGLALAAGTAVTLGAIGRLAALLLVLPVGFHIIWYGLDWANGAALGTAVYLMLMGTGTASLWQPEERFMVKRAGE